MEAKLLEIKDNVNAKQFETRVDGYLAKVEYMEGGNRIFLTHTEVAPQLEGKGIAAALVERVLSIIDERGQKMVPFALTSPPLSERTRNGNASWPMASTYRITN